MGQSAPLRRPERDVSSSPSPASATVAQTREAALAEGFRLEFFSVSWNILEVAVGMVAGLAAGSVALIGFALDSVAEASSAAVLLWRIRAERGSGRTAEDVERKAVRLVSIAFFVLAGYVGVRAIWDLATQSRPEESIPGIVLALVSLIVMPILARQKGRVARRLDSRSLQADSRQTVLCTYLSAFLLVGLASNSAFGWWWADPVAGLAIAVIAANEGRELWRTEDFCCL